MGYLSDELSHAGVKGMRWGVRKNSSAGGSSSGRTPGRSKTGTDVKKLTDNQLDKRISRLKKEKEYLSLSTPLKGPKVINGKKLVGDIIENSAKQVLSKLITAAALAGAKKLAEAKFGLGR